MSPLGDLRPLKHVDHYRPNSCDIVWVVIHLISVGFLMSCVPYASIIKRNVIDKMICKNNMARSIVFNSFYNGFVIAPFLLSVTHLLLNSYGYHFNCSHCNDVIMGAMAFQITSLTIVYSTVYSGLYQRKHQSSASLAFVRGIHWWPVNSPYIWPVTREMFPFDDVIMDR